MIGSFQIKLHSFGWNPRTNSFKKSTKFQIRVRYNYSMKVCQTTFSKTFKPKKLSTWNYECFIIYTKQREKYGVSFFRCVSSPRMTLIKLITILTNTIIMHWILVSLKYIQVWLKGMFHLEEPSQSNWSQ